MLDNTFHSPVLKCRRYRFPANTCLSLSWDLVLKFVSRRQCINSSANHKVILFEQKIIGLLLRLRKTLFVPFSITIKFSYILSRLNSQRNTYKSQVLLFTLQATAQQAHSVSTTYKLLNIKRQTIDRSGLPFKSKACNRTDFFYNANGGRLCCHVRDAFFVFACIT